jgi:ABC-type uncharacterized transport system ATPase subunit
MERPYIDRLHIENYGCIKDLTLNLTPLHALIGPNDSGKSTVLTALRTLTMLAVGPIDGADDSAKLDSAFQANAQLVVEGSAGVGTWRVLRRRHSGWSMERVSQPGVGQGEETPLDVRHGSNWRGQDEPPLVALRGSILLRLEPDELRKATQLIPEGQPLRFQNALGLGLPAIYDAIVTRDLPAYMAINARLRTLYPTVKSLALKNPSPTTKALGVQLTDGTFVGADFMSEGMLYYLAYAALPHLAPAAIILVEEPENGLHPARIREVMHVLREISKATQVLIATHSPLVVNELQPEEVTVLTRKPDEGTKGRLIKDTPNFAERSKVYALGELWVSYADGTFEEPLFKEPEPTPQPGEPVEWNEGDER